MSTPQLLLQSLRAEMRRAGLTYRALAGRVGMSESSIKRVFSSGDMSLTRLAQFCQAAGVSMHDVMQQALQAAPETDRLTLEQERSLVADPMLLLVAVCCLGQWSFEQIVETYRVEPAPCTAALVRLDRLGLIELQPRDRVRLRVPRDFRWRSHGPVRRRYGAQVLQEFMLDRFGGERSLLRFEARELSEASIQVLRRKLERLALEVAELAELDAGLPESRKRSMGVAVAMRPWVFSLAAALKASVAKPAR